MRYLLDIPLSRFLKSNETQLKMENEKIQNEIKHLSSIIDNKKLLIQEIIDELKEISKTHNISRRTRIEYKSKETSQNRTKLFESLDSILLVADKGFVHFKIFQLALQNLNTRGYKLDIKYNKNLNSSEFNFFDMQGFSISNTVLFISSNGYLFKINGYEVITILLLLSSFPQLVDKWFHLET